jgi:hypothetical protein
MGKTRKNYSLTKETIGAIDAEADRLGVSASEALEGLVSRAAKSPQEQTPTDAPTSPQDGARGARTSGPDDDRLNDLKDEIQALRAQLGAKDAQIAALSTIATQAQAVSMATVRQLGAGQGECLANTPSGETTGNGDDDEKGGTQIDTPGGVRLPLRVRLGRWIAGDL